MSTSTYKDGRFYQAGEYRKFTRATSLDNKGIKAIAAGYDHTLALSDDGKVYAAGTNNYGQVGFGDSGWGKSSYPFALVPPLSDKDIIAIAAGDQHSLALAKDGKVYAAGYNRNGQLGLGDKDNRSNFTEVASLSGKKIIAIAAAGAISIGSGSHSLALDSDGKVYGAGAANYGQLGLGDNVATNISGFTEVTSLKGKKIIAIFAGGAHSFAIAKDGKVYGAGYNGRGELALDCSSICYSFTEIPSLKGKNIIALAAGESHSLALAKNGKVYGAGSMGYGKLGLGYHSIMEGGRLISQLYSFTEIPSLKGKNIIDISAGKDFSLAVSKEGKLYVTGDNENGQLGLGYDNYDSFNPNKFLEVAF
jgi:alpha-tubulin suppressor-like RCC1 family protein